MSDYWTDDLELPALNDVSPAHRRSHSDPTEMLDLRDQLHLIRDDPFEAVGVKRQASPVPGLSPAFKRQSAGEWLDAETNTSLFGLPAMGTGINDKKVHKLVCAAAAKASSGIGWCGNQIFGLRRLT